MGVAAGKGSARAEIAGVGAVVQIGRAVLDLVLPTLCAACGRATHGAREPLCTACAADLALQVGGDWCRVCGSDVGPHLLEEGRCGECRRARPKIERLVRVGRHDGALRGLVLGLKRHPTVDGVVGGLLAEAWRGEMGDARVDALVPVPSPVMRVCMRGHQPTSLLAARVSRAIGVPVRRWLGMARTVRPQLGLSAGEREANVRGAFAARRATRVAGRTVCVVDDVTTTGATLREAARALRSAGAARVYGLVVSKMNLTTWDAGAGA